MSDAEKERVYDEEIAPLLLQASKRATEIGMPLFCIAEWNEGQIGKTVSGHDKRCFPFAMTMTAHDCGGNLDAFYIAVVRYCREHGIDAGASIVARAMTPA